MHTLTLILQTRYADVQPDLAAVLAACARAGRPWPPPAHLSAALCASLHLADAGHCPAAPILARASGLDTRTGYWLRLDPVHLDITLHGPTLQPARLLTPAEADRFNAEAAAILPPLGAHFHPAASGGGGWVELERPPAMTTTPLDAVLGRSPIPHLPRGEGARDWLHALHHLQMALHDDDGRAAANSGWLWGGGLGGAAGVPSAPAADIGRCGDAEVLGAWHSLFPAPPAHLDVWLTTTQQAKGVCVLDADNHTNLAETWLLPALRRLRHLQLRRLILIQIGNQPRACVLGPWQAWRALFTASRIG